VALRQALELQAVLVATRPHQNNKYIPGKPIDLPDEKMHNNQGAGTAENRTTSGAIAHTEEKQRITSARNEKVGHQETNKNRREDRNGDQVTTWK
jgi:hypothetical protein